MSIVLALIDRHDYSSYVDMTRQCLLYLIFKFKVIIRQERPAAHLLTRRGNHPNVYTRAHTAAQPCIYHLVLVKFSYLRANITLIYPIFFLCRYMQLLK